jgi:GNAT superfamily N-acetyltransferase
MQKINVHIAKKSDLKVITSYYHELYKGDEKQRFYGSKISPENFRSGQSLLVANINKEIVGYIWFVWYEHIKHKGVAYFEDLYVDKKHRQIGVGAALIKRAMALLQKRHISTVYVAVGKHLKDAQIFYNSIGFKPSDELWFERSKA